MAHDFRQILWRLPHSCSIICDDIQHGDCKVGLTFDSAVVDPATEIRYVTFAKKKFSICATFPYSHE